MIGGWKEEMNIDVEMLFWQIHGDMMTNLGYSRQKNSKKINVPLIPYKILIEANKLMMENNDGIKRYQTELLSNFILLQDIFPKKWEIDLYLPGGNIINLNGLQKIIKRIKVLPSFVYNTLSWIYRKLPFKYALSSFRKMFSSNVNRLNNEKFKKYDLIHIPLPQNFHYLKNANNKFLVTIHDLTHKFFPEFHKSENIKLAEDGIKSLITKDAHLIAISKSTKQDLIKYYPEIKPDDVSVIYEACNRSQFEPKKEEYLKQKVLKKYELPECPYFLCVSTLEPRKNILNTIKAFKKLTKENKNQELALFICGNNGWKMDELLKEQKLTQQNIYFTGFLNEEDLPVLYSNALALCYISIYEGFGLPPLEAMACGTTVIYGNNSSMPEIIGEAGVAADPSNIDDIKSKMNLLLNNQYREDLNYKALQRAHQFSWLKTAWETLNLYEELIEKNKPIT
jgi:glycosyltransferase involved in cell wall biosynthesis